MENQRTVIFLLSLAVSIISIIAFVLFDFPFLFFFLLFPPLFFKRSGQSEDILSCYNCNRRLNPDWQVCPWCGSTILRKS
jgi:hypothetical protein